MKSALSILLLCFLLASCGEEKTVYERAKEGDAEAQYEIGLIYSTGESVPVDKHYAATWFRKAAEQGHPGARQEVDKLNVTPMDDTEAEVTIQERAEQGNAEAQFALGVMYYNGDGVPLDKTEALKWYRKAAAQGNAEAQYNLGFMYYDGLGVPQDYTEAMKWLRKAAEQGDEMAQQLLAGMYHNGTGVPQDYAKAYMFFNLAAGKGSGNGKGNREMIKKRMTKEQIAEGQKLTREWLERKAKENGE